MEAIETFTLSKKNLTSLGHLKEISLDEWVNTLEEIEFSMEYGRFSPIPKEAEETFLKEEELSALYFKHLKI